MISNPMPGQEDEYNRWYTDDHLKDVVAVAGFASAERFKVVMEATDRLLPGKYVAIYEIDADDPKAAFAQLGKDSEAGKLPLSPAFDTKNVSCCILTSMAPIKRQEQPVDSLTSEEA
ncbi:MAG TPA: hypothetical protein VGL34_07025 [Steroidobacteraceae bacterium]